MAEPVARARVTQDNPSGNVQRGKEVISPGTPRERVVETGQHRVKAQGGMDYIGSSWSPLGVDGADEERSLAQGLPKPTRFADRQMQAEKNMRRKIEEEARKRAGLLPETPGSAAPAAAPAAGGLDPELNAQLAAFEGDEEMQLKVLKRWNAKLRERAAAAPKVAEPVTA